jgi:DNA-binding response OmpR family regulator
LLQLVWGYADPSAGHLLDVHLGRLRRCHHWANGGTQPNVAAVRRALERARS